MMTTLGTRLGVVQRSRNQTALAVSVYGHSGISMQCGRPVVSTPAGQIIHHRIYLPANAELKYRDPNLLLIAVESAESRRDAVVARRLDVSLPRQLPIDAQVKIVDWIAGRFADLGVPVQADLHITDALDGNPNPHAHFLIAERRLLGDQYEPIKCQDVIASFRTGFGRPLRLRLAEIINQVAQEAGFPEPLVSASPIPVDRMTEPRMARREFKSRHSSRRRKVLKRRANPASPKSEEKAGWDDTPAVQVNTLIDVDISTNPAFAPLSNTTSQALLAYLFSSEGFDEIEPNAPDRQEPQKADHHDDDTDPHALDDDAGFDDDPDLNVEATPTDMDDDFDNWDDDPGPDFDGPDFDKPDHDF